MDSYTKRYLILFSIFISFQLTAKAQSTEHLHDLKVKDAIDIAIQNNKMLKIQALKVQNYSLNEKNVKNEHLPDINFLSSYHLLSTLDQYEDGWGHSPTVYHIPKMKYNFTLQAEIPIYMGGKILTEEKKSVVETEIAALKLHKSEREITLQVITAYLNGLHLKEQLKLIQDKMHEDSLVIFQTEKMKQNGTVTSNDVLRTKLQLSNHQMAFSELEKEFIILEHEVKTILALHEEEELTISMDGLITEIELLNEFEGLVEKAYAQNESMLITQKELALKKLDQRMVKANYLPTLTGSGEYGYYYPNFMFFPPVENLYRFGTIGVNLRIPLSSLYKNGVRMKMAQHEIEMAHLEVEEKEEQISHEVFAGQKRLEEASKKIKIAQLAIEQAAENYRIVKTKYANQLSLITELIDADNAYLEAQSNLISLQINKQLKYYQLQYILGNNY